MTKFASHIKKTITLPRALVDQMQASHSNVSAFIAQACREKLTADALRAREAEMIERCQVRFQEDLATMADFEAVDRESWPGPQ